MSQLSPAKYIQTRVRTLPIYKCLVTKSWKDFQMADVMVVRKHTNGNVTAGLYAMDLHCLGVKTTSFLFNIPEEQLLRQIEDSPFLYEEITYTLAHNIIFAGHDFAMEFDIQPHKDFNITRYILEDDTDDIPLIDVPLGTGGRPHLVVVTANQRPEVLAKLKKNPGPGNFLYSVGEEQDFNEYFLDGIPPGKVDCENVMFIEDLDDEVKVSKRNFLERIVINAERWTRKIPKEALYVTDKEDAEWKDKWTVSFDLLPTGMDGRQFEEYDNEFDKVLSKRSTGSKEELEEKLMLAANKHSYNPLLMEDLYATATLMGMEKLKMIAELHAEKLCSQYPFVKITLALGALIHQMENNNDDDEQDDRYVEFEEIYEAESIKDLFPNQTTFDHSAFINFALIKMLLCILEEDIPYAVKFYRMIANSSGKKEAFLPYVWGEYANYLADLLEEEDEEKKEEE